VPAPTPTPAPSPTPTPTPGDSSQPIGGLPQVIAAQPFAPGLAVVGPGIRMPVAQLAMFEKPVPITVAEKPVRPAVRKAIKAPVVPVRPAKQARH